MIIHQIIVTSGKTYVSNLNQNTTMKGLPISSIYPDRSMIGILHTQRIHLRRRLTLNPMDRTPMGTNSITRRQPNVYLTLRIRITRRTELRDTRSIQRRLINMLHSTMRLPLISRPQLSTLSRPRAILDTGPMNSPHEIVNPHLLRNPVPHASMNTYSQIMITQRLPFANTTPRNSN